MRNNELSIAELNREIRRKPLKKHKKRKGMKKTGKGKKHLKRKMIRRKKTKTTTVEPPKGQLSGLIYQGISISEKEESIRVRRSVISASSYSLKSSDRMTPFSGLARSLTKTVRQLKHKDDGNSKKYGRLIIEK